MLKPAAKSDMTLPLPSTSLAGNRIGSQTFAIGIMSCGAGMTRAAVPHSHDGRITAPEPWRAPRGGCRPSG